MVESTQNQSESKDGPQSEDIFTPTFTFENRAEKFQVKVFSRKILG